MSDIEIITQIAKDVLNIDTLETQNSDSYDFHEVSVWNLKEALIEAYIKGLTKGIDITR